MRPILCVSAAMVPQAKTTGASEMNYRVEKVENCPTPTGIGTTNMYEVRRADGSLCSRHWNKIQANDQARYYNKYGEPTKRTSNNYGTPAVQPIEGGAL